MRYMLDTRRNFMSPKPNNEQVVVVQQLPPPTQIPIHVWSPLSQIAVVRAPPPPPQVVIQVPYSPPHPTPPPMVRAPRIFSMDGKTHHSSRMYIHEQAPRSPNKDQAPHSFGKTHTRRPTHTERVPLSITGNNEKRTPSVNSYNTRQSTASSHYPLHPYVEDAIDSPKPAPHKAQMLRTPSG
jgi:hypothetical protein